MVEFYGTPKINSLVIKTCAEALIFIYLFMGRRVMIIIQRKSHDFITIFLSPFLIKNEDNLVNELKEQSDPDEKAHVMRVECSECGNVEQFVSVTCVEVAVPEIHHRSSYRTSSRTSGRQRGTM